MDDMIYRQAAIDAAKMLLDYYGTNDISKEFADHTAEQFMNRMPSAQPEIIRCRNCVYGEQDVDGWWFCSNLGCQIGDRDGSGFCADAERRTDE